LGDGLMVSEVLKPVTGRQRPLEGDGGGHFFHGGDGFPSGHTLESFALASVIAHQYHDNTRVVVQAYGLATMAGGRRNTERSPAKGWLSHHVVPQIRPSDHTYGVLLAWRR